MTDAYDGPPVSLDGPTIAVVAFVVARALGQKDVETDVGFFDLGASSIVVVAVVEKLRQRWPDLRVVDVFLHPTVVSLAAFLDSSTTS